MAHGGGGAGAGAGAGASADAGQGRAGIWAGSAAPGSGARAWGDRDGHLLLDRLRRPATLVPLLLLRSLRRRASVVLRTGFPGQDKQCRSVSTGCVLDGSVHSLARELPDVHTPGATREEAQAHGRRNRRPPWSRGNIRAALRRQRSPSPTELARCPDSRTLPGERVSEQCVTPATEAASVIAEQPLPFVERWRGAGLGDYARPLVRPACISGSPRGLGVKRRRGLPA
jgi:hypothetical protein